MQRATVIKQDKEWQVQSVQRCGVLSDDMEDARLSYVSKTEGQLSLSTSTKTWLVPSNSRKNLALA